MSKEVVKVSAELQRNLDLLTAFKAEVDKIGNDCKQIKIVDESLLAIGQQNLSKANNLSNSIEEKRKVIKQPYFDAGTLIDSTCKNIVKGLNEGISYVKSEIASWEKKRLEEERKKQEEVDHKLREEQEKVAAETKRKQDIRDHIDNRSRKSLENCYSRCLSALDCDAQLDVITKNYKGEDFFQEFTKEAFDLRDRYIDLIKAKKEQYLAADSQSSAEKELALKQEELERKRIDFENEQRKLEAEKETIRLAKEKEERERVATEEKARLEALAATERTKGVRYTWGFELSDITKVPAEWLTIDEAKIKAYLKENKDKMKEGELNGVRFFKNTVIVA